MSILLSRTQRILSHPICNSVLRYLRSSYTSILVTCLRVISICLLTTIATMAENPLVLVTGASGFIGTHIVQQLLQSGQYKVRGTVRSLENEVKVGPIRKLFPETQDSLELVEAELTDHNSWIKATQGCTYVIHTASPRPAEVPEDEKEVIRPAVDGTRSVLKACRSAGTVKRVVVTSSIAAITADFDAPDKREIKDIYDEKDWTDTSRTDLSPYFKSKPLAEKAAWDYTISLSPEEKFELVVINPGFVMGPVLCGILNTSMETPRKLLEREMPLLPKLNMNIVDVRDVAQAHIHALTVPEAAGHRHILCTKSMWFKEIAQILDAEFKQYGYKVPTVTSPDIGIKFIGLFDKTVKMITPMLSRVIHLDTRRMTNVLGIQPRDPKTTIIDMAYSMIENGMVKKAKGYNGPPPT